jgi:hypothetical protein
MKKMTKQPAHQAAAAAEAAAAQGPAVAAAAVVQQVGGASTVPGCGSLDSGLHWLVAQYQHLLSNVGCWWVGLIGVVMN